MTQIFKSGKYSGKSIAQLAIQDYQAIVSLQNFLKGKNEFLVNSIGEVVKKLNNFVPKVDCKFHEGCDKKADYISIGLSHGLYGFDGVSASTEYIGCKNHIDDVVAMYHKAQRYPIKFDTILQMPRNPRYVMKDVQKVLLECAGFSGKKSLENCEMFITNLEQRI